MQFGICSVQVLPWSYKFSIIRQADKSAGKVLCRWVHSFEGPSVLDASGVRNWIPSGITPDSCVLEAKNNYSALSATTPVHVQGGSLSFHCNISPLQCLKNCKVFLCCNSLPRRRWSHWAPTCSSVDIRHTSQLRCSVWSPAPWFLHGVLEFPIQQD